MKTILGLALALTLILLGTAPAAAVTITFQAIDLADVSPGNDLWRYVYVVAGFADPANVAFETLFAPGLYTDLEDPPPVVNADWDIVTIQPDPLLPDVGRYSALALVDGASLPDPFTLTFVWLGGPGTRPGSQPFEINQLDASGDFIATLETGVTIPARAAPSVPLPSTLLLAVSGLVAMVLARRRS